MWLECQTSLLSCSIPDLELDDEVIQLHGLSQEGSTASTQHSTGGGGGVSAELNSEVLIDRRMDGWKDE